MIDDDPDERLIFFVINKCYFAAIHVNFVLEWESRIWQKERGAEFFLVLFTIGF